MSSATITVDEAFSAAQKLAPADKLQLISRLWESIRLEGSFRLSESELAELQRRSAELDAGIVKAVPWEVVRDSVRARLTAHD
jgi:putative addiction module component (TIGR02574 family)